MVSMKVLIATPTVNGEWGSRWYFQKKLKINKLLIILDPLKTRTSIIASCPSDLAQNCLIFLQFRCESLTSALGTSILKLSTVEWPLRVRKHSYSLISPQKTKYGFNLLVREVQAMVKMLGQAHVHFMLLLPLTAICLSLEGGLERIGLFIFCFSRILQTFGIWWVSFYIHQLFL